MLKSDDTGKLILRLTLGVLILLHGLYKLTNGVGGISSMLAQNNLPSFLAYFVYIGEVVAPILLIMGIYTRLGGLLIAGNMVVAILLAHRGSMFSIIGGTGGWALELQGMFLFTGLAIAMLGAGRFSLSGSGGRWN